MTLLHGSTLLTAYAVARDFCNGKPPSCSSQAAREWYKLRRRQDAFSRGVPLFGRWKNSFFSVNAFLMGNSINRFLRFVNRSCRVLPQNLQQLRRRIHDDRRAGLCQRLTAPKAPAHRRQRQSRVTGRGHVHLASPT